MDRGLVRLATRPEQLRRWCVVEEDERLEVVGRLAQRGHEIIEAVPEVRAEIVDRFANLGLIRNRRRVLAAKVGSRPAVHHRLMGDQRPTVPRRAGHDLGIEPGALDRADHPRRRRGDHIDVPLERQ